MFFIVQMKLPFNGIHPKTKNRPQVFAKVEGQSDAISRRKVDGKFILECSDFILFFIYTSHSYDRKPSLTTLSVPTVKINIKSNPTTPQTYMLRDLPTKNCVPLNSLFRFKESNRMEIRIVCTVSSNVFIAGAYQKIELY